MPLRYGSRVTGAIVISKLGLDQFDEDDIRLLEVLAGQASVALENARLYEQQRREAESAKALLAFTDEVCGTRSRSTRSQAHRQTAAALFETDVPRSGSAMRAWRRSASELAGGDLALAAPGGDGPEVGS